MLLSSTLLILTLYIFGRIIIVNRRHKNIMIDVLILLGFILLNILVFKYTTGTIKTIITCLLYSSLFFSIFKIKLSKSIFTSIVYIILLVIPDLLTLGGAIYIFDVSKEFCYESLSGSIISNFSVLGIMIILTVSIRKPLKKLINYNLSTNKKIIVMSSITLVMLAIFFYNLIKTF